MSTHTAVEIGREALFACLHDVFVTLDHGRKLADDFLLFLVDEDGNALACAIAR